MIHAPPRRGRGLLFPAEVSRPNECQHPGAPAARHPGYRSNADSRRTPAACHTRSLRNAYSHCELANCDPCSLWREDGTPFTVSRASRTSIIRPMAPAAPHSRFGTNADGCALDTCDLAPAGCADTSRPNECNSQKHRSLITLSLVQNKCRWPLDTSRFPSLLPNER